MIGKLINVGSGEFFLRDRPNGGTAVLLRTVFVTLIAYPAAIGARSYTSEGAALEFSLPVLLSEINATLPWLGAIFAGSYAALYARFSSQWNYLANLYNQLMSICVNLPEADRKANSTLVNWRAAFIEDALDLHLATKPMFATAIHEMLGDTAVRTAFVSSTADGANRLVCLEAKLDVIYGVRGRAHAGPGAPLDPVVLAIAPGQAA